MIEIKLILDPQNPSHMEILASIARGIGQCVDTPKLSIQCGDAPQFYVNSMIGGPGGDSSGMKYVHSPSVVTGYNV